MAIWECKPSRFTWHYDEREVCLIIEGEAIIKTAEDEIYKITSGDFVEFPEGLSCEWNIIKSIRKHYRLGN